MNRNTFVLTGALVLIALADVHGQVAASDQLAVSRGIAKTSSSTENPTTRKAGNLQRVETTTSPSEVAEAIAGPPKCDSDGNFYLKTTPDGIAAIHKLSGKGERLALFQPKAPNLKVDFSSDFSIAPNGELSELVYAQEISRYVLVHKPDGSLRATVKLQPGFAFMPYLLAALPSGDLFISGLEPDHDKNNHAMWPFNGIFSPDGVLRKEVSLADDEMIHDMAASGDLRAGPVTNPSANHVVSWGAVEAGPDGNVYLMRRLSPAILYAIGPDGSVVRRFTVTPGSDDFMPFSMHLAGDRIAVLFHNPQAKQMVIVVVDLKGHEMATYSDSPSDRDQVLGLAFACYAHEPERFTFLETGTDNKLEFRTVTWQ